MAHTALKNMETKNVGSGRKKLFDAYQDYGNGLADAIHRFYDSRLMAAGKTNWPLRG